MVAAAALALWGCGQSPGATEDGSAGTEGTGADATTDTSPPETSTTTTSTGSVTGADTGAGEVSGSGQASTSGGKATGSGGAESTGEVVVGEKQVVFITTQNETPVGAAGEHQLHVVGPSGDYDYKWGNEDYVYTGNTIDMDVNDELGLIAVGGGQGNINNKVLVFDYDGNKVWETGSNGNTQGTLFYRGSGDRPILAVGYHDNRVDVGPDSEATVDALGFYARDADGLILDWRPRFRDGGGQSPFQGGGLNVWRFFADETNDRLFVMGEFAAAETSAGVRTDVDVSRVAVYQQNPDGTFPEQPERVPRFGASWFISSNATTHVGNPWVVAQTPTHYYVGGHSFDSVEDLGGTVHSVNSLVRLDVSNYDLDPTWTPSFGPEHTAATTDSDTVVVRDLRNYGDEILMGGRFDAFQDLGRDNLAAFDAVTGAINDRFSDVSVNDGEVYSIAVDGDFAYIAGTFRSVTDSTGTQDRNRVACIDLSDNTVTDWNPGSGSRATRIRVIELAP